MSEAKQKFSLSTAPKSPFSTTHTYTHTYTVACNKQEVSDTLCKQVVIAGPGAMVVGQTWWQQGPLGDQGQGAHTLSPSTHRQLGTTGHSLTTALVSHGLCSSFLAILHIHG